MQKQKTQLTTQRLQKFLARAGLGSRRYCEKLIEMGKIKVNGNIVKTLGTKIEPQKDNVEFAGEKVNIETKNYYLILNKPKDTITTRKDPKNRKTVYDLLPEEIRNKVFAVGRLDRNTTGLLLFTNDGELANTLIHPKHKIKKVYLVKIDKNLAYNDLQKLENGVKLDNKLTQAATIEFFLQKKNVFYITITEGINRQVRRMLEIFGYKVLNLKRVSFGGLKLHGLALGQFRYLENQDLENIRKIIKTGVDL